MADKTAKSAKNSFHSGAEAEKVATRLPELDLKARKLASLIHGLRKRNKPGPGIEFDRFTPFQPDIHDPRKIDWKASARLQDHEGNDRYLIREREMEVAHNIYLWLDNSGSMDFKAPADLFPQQPAYNKKEAAEILMLAIAYLAVSASERFTLLDSNLGLSGNKAGIQRMKQEIALRNSNEAKNEDLPKLPVHRGKPLGNGSHVIIFSDFLCPVEEIAETIKSLHRAGVKGHLIQVLDPAEIEFRYKGHVKFKSLEDDFTHTVKKSEAVKKEVEETIRNHIKQVNDLVQRIPGWDFNSYSTDRPLHEALLPLYGIKANRPPADMNVNPT